MVVNQRFARCSPLQWTRPFIGSTAGPPNSSLSCRSTALHDRAWIDVPPLVNPNENGCTLTTNRLWRKNRHGTGDAIDSPRDLAALTRSICSVYAAYAGVSTP
jgi:hypothetical protein